MEKIKQAMEYFGNDHSCSQSVFCTFAPQLGLSYELAYKIAAAFGGGMSRMGNTCGAVSGALMTIGLHFRTLDKTDSENKDLTYEMGQKFIAEFIKIHGSVMCNTLVGYDIRTTKGLEKAEKKKVFETKCPNFVKDSVKILNSMLDLKEELAD
jgi:C_GCAxxG_C_C family probable redox protein